MLAFLTNEKLNHQAVCPLIPCAIIVALEGMKVG